MVSAFPADSSYANRGGEGVLFYFLFLLKPLSGYFTPFSFSIPEPVLSLQTVLILFWASSSSQEDHPRSYSKNPDRDYRLLISWSYHFGAVHQIYAAWISKSSWREPVRKNPDSRAGGIWKDNYIQAILAEFHLKLLSPQLYFFQQSPTPSRNSVDEQIKNTAFPNLSRNSLKFLPIVTEKSFHQSNRQITS